MIPYGIKLAGVLLASYACFALALDAALAAAWFAYLRRRSWSAPALLTLRLAPIGGAALLCASVVLPAFLWYEPTHRREPLGGGLLGLGAFAVLLIGAGLARAWRASAATERLVRRCAAGRRRRATADVVEIVDVTEPIVAVFGALRPRILAARRVVQACSAEEFQGIVDHETAHVAAADNFKLALASALIKVARLAERRMPVEAAHVMAVAHDHIEERVRRLLGEAPAPPRRSLRLALIGLAAATPIVALPAYGVMHRCIEWLVALRF